MCVCGFVCVCVCVCVYVYVYVCVHVCVQFNGCDEYEYKQIRTNYFHTHQKTPHIQSHSDTSDSV